MVVALRIKPTHFAPYSLQHISVCTGCTLYILKALTWLWGSTVNCLCYNEQFEDALLMCVGESVSTSVLFHLFWVGKGRVPGSFFANCKVKRSYFDQKKTSFGIKLCCKDLDAVSFWPFWPVFEDEKPGLYQLSRIVSSCSHAVLQNLDWTLHNITLHS